MSEEILEGTTVEELHEQRLREEREWYLSEEGFLDFARDSGAAPDAQFEPHGRYSKDILRWERKPDPERVDGWIYIYKLILWPRGAFKSSVYDVALVCWEIARNPNVRILVGSETGKQAKKFVELSKEIIDSQWYRDRFGVHRGRKDWTTGSFKSALRTEKHTKEATLQAAGVGEVWTGSHWDLVLLDDVVSQENTKTPEGIEATNNWFGEILAQLDPGRRLMLIGTLHHFADLYCKIMKNPQVLRMFTMSVHSWRNPDGTLFFPGRLTTAFVDQQKALMSPRLFACFYENKPFTEEQQIFKPEYFKVIRDEEIPGSVWTYILTDFAFIADERKNGRSDRTCFWVVSLDCNRIAYVRDFYVGRWKPSDSVKIACDLWNRYQHINLKGVIVERTVHNEILLSAFEEIRRSTFIHPRMIVVEGRSQEIKEIRIEGIEPKFRRGDIYFAQSIKSAFKSKWKPLIDEMTEWPFSSHDDIPDAISDIDKRVASSHGSLGKFVCPAPPLGWRVITQERNQPSTVDGRFNPSYGYPARETTKQPQLGQIGEDLWRTGRSSPDKDSGKPPNHDLFQKRLL